METITIEAEITIKIGDNKIKLSKKDAELLYNSLSDILGKNDLAKLYQVNHVIPYHGRENSGTPNYLLHYIRC